MRTFLLLLVFTGSYFVSKAQAYFDVDKSHYAVIKDPDGFVNIRKAPNNKALIVGKIRNDKVFICEPSTSNWWLVEDAHEGYVYKDRVQLLSKWNTARESNISTNRAIVKNDSIFITVKSADFDNKTHKLSDYKGHSNTNYDVDKIDSKRFWGTDGEVPKRQISYFKITKNGQMINIPKNAFSDLYEPRLKTLSICSSAENTFYIRMDNSDGAGAYTVIWIIKDNKYYDRYIDISND